MKKRVKVYIEEDAGLYNIEGSLKNTIDLLSKYLNDVPKEYQDTIEIYFQDSPWTDKVFDITYLRPETDEEETLRLEQEKNQAERKRQEDLKLLERLKQEYENEKQKILRVRFKANQEDYRPINWPVKYPYWCTGYGFDFSVVVSYADSEKYIYENWPDAKDLDIDEVEEIKFTDRFPKPDWYV